MTLATDIQKLVETEQIKAQLNPDILQKVLDLQKNATALELELGRNKEWLEKQRAENAKLQAEVSAANTKVEAMAKREAACAEREKQITQLELRAQHQAERVEDHKEMFRLVFRNVETRRDIFTAVPGTRGSEGTYSNPQQSYVSRDEQRESAE